MERLIDSVLECSVYLYETESDARRGTRAGGSGFLYKVPYEKNDQFGDGALYAVTNWHVASVAPVIRLNTKDEKFDVLPYETTQWIRHPDQTTDLAIVQIGLITKKYQVRALGPHHLLTKNRLPQYDVGIGDEVFAIGRFVNQEGEQRNTPAVRYGAIAQMPSDPIVTGIGPQEAYLAEIRSIAGYSGSPVIALIPGARDPNIIKMLAGNAPTSDAEKFAKQTIARARSTNSPLPGSFMFLGIDSGHLRRFEPVLDRGQNETGMFVESNTGMAIVIVAWKLAELLDSKEVRRMRDDAKKKNRRPSTTTLDVASDPVVQRTRVPKRSNSNNGQFESDLVKATWRLKKKLKSS